MKKEFLLIFVLILFTGLVYSQSIEVLKPVASDYTHSGYLYIVWKAEGITGNVKITLRKEDGSGGIVLKESHPVDGRPVKKYLTDIPSGKYFVKVKQGSVFGKSEVFTLLADSISVVSVSIMKTVEKNKISRNAISMMWESINIAGDVKIILRKKDGSGGFTIKENYPVDKRSLYWEMPLSVSSGEYFIKIKQGSVFGKSSVFKIVESPFKKLIIKTLKPDLKISVSKTISARGYDSFFNVLVKNISGVDIKKEARIEFIIHDCKDKLIDNNNKYIVIKTIFKKVKPLNAGEHQLHIFKYAFDTPGTYSVSAYVGGEFSELNKKNNHSGTGNFIIE